MKKTVRERKRTYWPSASAATPWCSWRRRARRSGASGIHGSSWTRADAPGATRRGTWSYLFRVIFTEFLLFACMFQNAPNFESKKVFFFPENSLPGSIPNSLAISTRSTVHRYMCCCVLEREQTTTGTPTSRWRRHLRDKSKKLEKLDTQPIKTGSRRITISLSFFSASIRASFRRCSTRLAWMDSSISVIPFIFQNRKKEKPSIPPRHWTKVSVVWMVLSRAKKSISVE